MFEKKRYENRKIEIYEEGDSAMMNYIYSSGNEIVDRIGQINFTGNVIPEAWYRTIKYENGKPNVNAILILSDIVYWYRPQEIRDEVSGKLIGYKKKFSSDMLQRNYQQIADKFGFTKRQATLAIDALKELGVIRKDFRNLKINGMCVNNVLFIELMPDVLVTLTYPTKDEKEMDMPISHYNETGITVERDTIHLEHPITIECNRSINEGLSPITLDEDTNTENTTKINAEIIKNPINQSDAFELVKSKFLKLKTGHLQYVISCMKENTSKVGNIKAYLTTALYNAPNTMGNYYQSRVNHDMYGFDEKIRGEI